MNTPGPDEGRQPDESAPPQYSADGQWWWTGARWVPVPEAPPAAPQQAPHVGGGVDRGKVTAVAVVAALVTFGFFAVHAANQTDQRNSEIERQICQQYNNC